MTAATPATRSPPRSTADQRKRIATRIKELQPEASNRAIAKTLGVDHKTVARDTGENSPPKKQEEQNQQQQTRDGGESSPPPTASGAEAARYVQRADSKAAAAQASEGAPMSRLIVVSRLIVAQNSRDIRRNPVTGYP